MRAALFITCLDDTLFPEVGIATVRILERLGVEVEFPVEQTCCGQIHFNTGYGHELLPLVRRFADTFGDAQAIVTRLARARRWSSSTTLAWPGVRVMSGSPPRSRRWPGGCTNSRRFLIEVLGVEDVGARFPHRVTYHASCHATRVMHVGDAPLRLLRAVHGIDLVELPEATTCCGFGGTFAVKNAGVSSAMLTDKIRTSSPPGRGLHRRRQLLPDAHRWRAAALHTGVERHCICARSSTAGRVMTSATSFPRRRRRGGSADSRSCATTSAHATAHDPPATAPSLSRSRRVGAAARDRGADQGRGAGAVSTNISSSSKLSVTAAGGHVHWACDARRGLRA